MTSPPPKPPPLLDERQRREMITWQGLERRRFDDVYHRLLVTSWPRLAMVVLAAYVLVNLLFALLYMAVPGCVQGADSLLDLFSFSVQTMATIGYGGMTPCSGWANAVVAVEALVGMIGFAMGTGMRDGQRFLMFRMANARDNLIVEASLGAVMLVEDVSSEGHMMRRMVDLALVRSRSPLFSMSFTAFHPIDEDSPLFGLDEAAFRERVSGIMLSLTGLDGTFHQTVYAQHAYGPDDVVWGGQFVDMIRIDRASGHYTVDHDKLHEVEPRSLDRH